MWTDEDGYRRVNVKGRNGSMRFCNHLVELVLGRSLPPKTVVHHVDSNRLNDGFGNLVVCQNEAYHKLLHQRTRALNACGDPHYRKCKCCGKYSDPKDMYINPSHRSGPIHFSCTTIYRNRNRAGGGGKKTLVKNTERDGSRPSRNWACQITAHSIIQVRVLATSTN